MIPKAAEVRLTPEDRAVLEARLRAPTTEQAKGTRRARLHARSRLCRERSAHGVADLRPRVWPARRISLGLAQSRSMVPTRRGAGTGSSGGFARRTGRLLAGELGMCMSSRSGASCGSEKSICQGANPGARATIPSSSPRPPRSSGSIWAARERDRHLRGREALDSGSGAGTRVPQTRQWTGPDWPQP